MQTEILYRPSYSLATVKLDPDETIQVEGGAMVGMTPDLKLETQAKGGIFKSLARSVLGGESFFMNTFTAPSQGKVFRPGDKILLKAMLRDSAADLMVRGLYDATQITRQRTVRNSDGESIKVPVYASLDPIVSITDSSGKQVASGKMPFG